MECVGFIPDFALEVLVVYHYYFIRTAFAGALIAMVVYSIGLIIAMDPSMKNDGMIPRTTVDVVFGSAKAGLLIYFWPLVVIYKMYTDTLAKPTLV